MIFAILEWVLGVLVLCGVWMFLAWWVGRTIERGLW